MPIEVGTAIRILDQEEFHSLDRRVMRIIFDIHNDFGRLLREELFKDEIAARCIEAGLSPAEREVPIRVSHDGFVKNYFIDLLVCHGVLVEAKTVETLIPTHRKQALNYLFLTGLQHGRLVNLRTERVTHEFISTHLTWQRRHDFLVVDEAWRDVNGESGWLKSKVVDLVRDWGAFLDVTLYREAITAFLGGPQAVCRPVEVFSGSRCLGMQFVRLLAEDTAFVFSAVTESQEQMKNHQLRFLKHTQLRHIQWVNFNHHRIEFATLSKSDR